MEIIRFSESKTQEHWLSEILRSAWKSGEILVQMVKDGSLKKIAGDHAEILLLTEGEELISFCMVGDQDDVLDPSLQGWTGFVFTFPKHRGKHYSGILLGAAEDVSRGWGNRTMYISTPHTGLYERYGYEFMETRTDMYGEEVRVYRKPLYRA